MPREHRPSRGMVEIATPPGRESLTGRNRAEVGRSLFAQMELGDYGWVAEFGRISGHFRICNGLRESGPLGRGPSSGGMVRWPAAVESGPVRGMGKTYSRLWVP